MNLSASYSKRRIGTLESLSKSLGINSDKLLLLAEESNHLYRNNSITKPNGSIRFVHDALMPLKNIHRKIKNQILSHVIYPEYLTGSIKGRDCKTNASFHSNARIIINEDIKNFFPSTSEENIFNIWKCFFNFSDEVAQCLTKLTTKNNELPQGAITSSFLANLVFWRDEPKLYSNFKKIGITYSRYVDDITVSSKLFLTKNEKSYIINQLHKMLVRNNYALNRSKHNISSSNKRMTTTGLNVNNKPSVNKNNRRKIRTSVHKIEKAIENAENISFEKGVYPQTMGRVLYLERFHPNEAASLKRRLLTLKPKN